MFYQPSKIVRALQWDGSLKSAEAIQEAFGEHVGINWRDEQLRMDVYPKSNMSIQVVPGDFIILDEAANEDQGEYKIDVLDAHDFGLKYRALVR